MAGHAPFTMKTDNGIVNLTRVQAIAEATKRVYTSFASITDENNWGLYRHPDIVAKRLNQFIYDFDSDKTYAYKAAELLVKFWNGRVLYRHSPGIFMLYNGFSFVEKDDKLFRIVLSKGLGKLWRAQKELLPPNGDTNTKKAHKVCCVCFVQCKLPLKLLCLFVSDCTDNG